MYGCIVHLINIGAVDEKKNIMWNLEGFSEDQGAKELDFYGLLW